MAADLHIHVMEGIDEDDLRLFFSNTWGSKYFDSRYCGEVRPGDAEYIKTHPLPQESVEMYERLSKSLREQGRDKEADRYASDKHDATRVASERVGRTPNIHVGEVSWLKAALFEDVETFVPGPVMKVSEAIGDEAVIDDALIEQIEKALQEPNTTSYSLSSVEDIMAFLRQHKGKTAFTISW